MSRMLSATLLSATLLLTVWARAVDKETALYNFQPRLIIGSNPTGGLLMDQSGNLYGAALSGTIFEFTPNGSGGWTYNLLCNCPTEYPFGFLVMDKAGNLYGSSYDGEVLEYSPSQSGDWTETIIYSFNGNGGVGPSPVTQDAAGNLYGTYASGGSHGLGYVFELSPSSGGTWSLTDLHDFDGSDGAESSGNDAGGLIGGVTMDASGNLYGTTGAGGSSSKCDSGCGVIFELKRNSGTWTETVLHSFNGSDGMNPDSPLFMDASRNLYGTTTGGGAGGFGVVFETSPVAGAWRTRDLYSFTNVGGDGAYPNSALVMDASGNLYGTTESGGGSFECTVVTDNGCGTAFELSEQGGKWKETILHDFTDGKDGGFPGGITLGTDGKLYGVALVGGNYGAGVFFQLSH